MSGATDPSKTEAPAISDYGMIGNCRTAALVSKGGSIDWVCFPNFDSPSYFGALLDQQQGGKFVIAPRGDFRSRQCYLQDSNILETTFETASGAARLLDCFTVTDEAQKNRMFWPANEILRTVEGLRGTVDFEVVYQPKPHYADHAHRRIDRGVWGVVYPCGHDELRLRHDLAPNRFTWRDDQPTPSGSATFRTRAGSQNFFSIVYSQAAPAVVPALGAEAQRRLELTQAYWTKWIRRCTYQGPYLAQVRRSALILKLLTFAPSGAIVAAPTTSLPEVLGGERNWDYRYSWLRDSSFTINALIELGYPDEAKAFLNWMLDTGAAFKKKYRIFYNLYGAPTGPERELPDFAGHQGSRPVRVGNAASDQLQLDVFGEVLESAWSYLQIDPTLMEREMKKFLRGMGDFVCKRWQDPDDGIWEPRGGRKHHVHSKVMAWVAMDRLEKIATRFAWGPTDQARFGRTADAIRASIETEGYSETLGAYPQSYGAEALDANVLVMPLVGFCPPDSSRIQSTLTAVHQALGRGELLYRYLGQEDGLQGQEGCFALCSFWYIQALALSGQPDRARTYFEDFLSRANPQGLWSEEIDPTSGGFLGNYPQGFTHVGLIHAALTLQKIAEGKVS